MKVGNKERSQPNWFRASIPTLSHVRSPRDRRQSPLRWRFMLTFTSNPMPISTDTIELPP